MADTKTTVKKTTTKKTIKKTVEVKTVEQLNEDLAKTLQELLEAKKSHRSGELVNPHVLTVKRKEVARIKTALSLESRKENE